VRWINDVVRPMPGAAGWMRFLARYPAVLLLLGLGTGGLGAFFWMRLTELERGDRASVYVGALRSAYDLFGKWGIVGFFLLIAAGWGYGFWYYALSKPRA
jgi:hypothetical protein